jgi:hypothetical protein
MGAYSRLTVGKGDPFIEWKYNSAPPLLAMLFEADEKQTQARTETDGDEIHEYIEVKYRTTVKQAVGRLASKGLTFDRTKKMAAAVLDMDVAALETLLFASKGKPLQDADYELEFLVDEGYFELAYLLTLWPIFEAADPDDPVVFDATETTISMETEEILEVDFVREARDSLRKRLQITSALLDYLRKPTPDSMEFVKKQLRGLSEDEFLERVVRPLLEAEGYQNVKVIEYHGPSEFGSDVKPMRKMEMGKWYYGGAQAKAERIEADAAPHVWAQIETALGVRFVDDADNIPKPLDRVFLFMAKGATSNAMRYLQERSFGRTVRFYDADDIATLVLKHDLQGNLT